MKSDDEHTVYVFHFVFKFMMISDYLMRHEMKWCNVTLTVVIIQRILLQLVFEYFELIDESSKRLVNMYFLRYLQ